jgi:predicted tellurium resistance membrane protein TerC
METVSFIDYSEKKLLNTTNKPARGKALFVTPIAVIGTLIAALALVTFSLLYFYPVVTIFAILLIGLALKLTLSRERLTFFDEQYSPDVFVENIEKEREKKYEKRSR